MSRNALIGILLVIAVALFLWFWFPGRFGTANQSQNISVTPVLTTSPLTRIVDGAVVYNPYAQNEKATLKNGQATFMEGDTESGFATVGDNSLELGSAIITIVTFNFGGSGDFSYLTAFEATQGAYEMAADQMLEDRVLIEDLSAKGDIVTITYLTHGPMQAMAEEPNVKVVKHFRYASGTFTPVEQ